MKAYKTHIRVPVPIDGEQRMAWVELPRDVTANEAKRVANIISTMGHTDNEHEAPVEDFI